MISVFLVDAFTAQAFGGNPAAVFMLDDSPRSEGWLLAMTREFGCEAAFLSPKPQKANDYGLRFFNTSGEDLFCGHGTLSSAHILYEQGLVTDDARISFDTVSGPFATRRSGTVIELDLPAEIALPVPPPAELLERLGADGIHRAFRWKESPWIISFGLTRNVKCGHCGPISRC